MHLLKYKEWQSPTGYWHCNDVDDLAGVSGLWYTPARMLGIPPVEFVKILVNEYKPDYISFHNNLLLYSWKAEHYNLCHKFVLWINRESRKRNFLC